MLKKFELYSSRPQIRSNVAKLLGAALAIVLLVFVSTLFLNNVVATPVSPHELEIRGWVNDLSDANLTTRRQAAETSLEAAGADAVPALTTALHSNDPVVRQNAADMLSFIASPSASAALQQSLAQDPVPAVRVNAASALGAIGTASGLNALDSAAVLDTSAPVREMASQSAEQVRSTIAQTAGKDMAHVQALTVAPGQANTVYLASGRDLLASHNGGAQWTTYTQALPSLVSTLSVNPTNPDIIYAGLHSEGMYLSTDAGHTWQSLTHNFSNQAIGSSTVTAITVDPADPMRVVMAHGILIGDANASFIPLGILTSKDGGKSWANVMDLQEGQIVTRLGIKDNTVYALAGDKILVAPLAN